MKQLLAVVVIHALIFHQYLKDKNESLATPPKRKIIKAITTPSPAQVSLQTVIIKNNSLYFYQPDVLHYPGAIDIIPARFWINGNMIRRQ